MERLYTNISLQLVPFEPRQFYQSVKHDVIKLVDTGGLVGTEPSCSTNEDCYITSTVSTECSNGSCREFSWIANSISAHRLVHYVTNDVMSCDGEVIRTVEPANPTPV